LTTPRLAGIVTSDDRDVERIDGQSASETQESVMKNVQEIHRKRVGKNKHDALMAIEDGAGGGGREKKKGRHAKRDRDRPAGRQSTESPRGSTIPPYPKQRIDD
jgi:hypothetical protein